MLRRVKIKNGWIEGLPAADPRITAFKGIPFAMPPTHSLRFHAPIPSSDWVGTMKTYQFKPISMQPVPGLDKDNIYTREWNVDPDIPMNEDCLYLNVWTPANHTDEKLPVFVWYFGGGWQVGNTAEMEFDGERFARRGIIFVSINYRVNIFGFLAHPEITAENPTQPANFGLLDQQLGTRWVKENIEAFGGDPDNITIGGQSAGGGSTLMHVVSRQNKGLFHRAIIQSGVLANPYEELVPKRTLSEAEHIGIELFDFLGVKSLGEARALPASYIMQKWNEYGGFSRSMKLWMPIYDGHFLEGDPIELFLDGRGQNIPLLLGHTGNEFPVIIHEESKEISSIEYGIRILLEYEEKLNPDLKHYYYEFDPHIPGWDKPGSFHSSDLWFTFETLAKCWRPFTGKHYDLARQMCNYWTNFIKMGNPNGIDHTGEPMPEWKPYTKSQPNKMLFTDIPHPTVAQPSPIMSFLVRNYFKRNRKN
ncbi:MAG: carboxylesterase family protein [Clostridiales bacterium]|jgi:para-nitrobenzyl esterase|nr:carboxylesterase family protein [Clostridiales bacterium]